MLPFACFNRKTLETLLPHRGAALRKIDGVFYNSSDSKHTYGAQTDSDE
jgi:hypothetical protein